MRICLDIVDLLQLREVWSMRPIVTAFTRLEPRPARWESDIDFRIDTLMPRLTRLKTTAAWRSNNPLPTSDPARVPLGRLSDDYLRELYPDTGSAAELRQRLFMAAYTRFVVADFRGNSVQLRALFQAIAAVRSAVSDDCLSRIGLPIEGAAEWIPAEITDEIRALDTRYRITEPGAPAAYVVAEPFWTLLVKATPQEIHQAIERCAPATPDEYNHLLQTCTALAEVAFAWSRSPSVVGLCYQIE